jgi:hypothetical protein
MRGGAIRTGQKSVVAPCAFWLQHAIVTALNRIKNKLQPESPSPKLTVTIRAAADF